MILILLVFSVTYKVQFFYSKLMQFLTFRPILFWCSNRIWITSKHFLGWFPRLLLVELIKFNLKIKFKNKLETKIPKAEITAKDLLWHFKQHQKPVLVTKPHNFLPQLSKYLRKTSSTMKIKLMIIVAMRFRSLHQTKLCKLNF